MIKSKIQYLIVVLILSVSNSFGQNYPSILTSFSASDLTIIDLEITDSGTITDLNIFVNLDHDYQDGLRYLTIQLLSPYGNAVVLGDGDQNGASPHWDGMDNDNLYHTIFDDEASVLIYDGSPPFAGSFLPEGSLSDFDGQSITGTWQLLVSNTFNSGFSGGSNGSEIPVNCLITPCRA